MELSFIILIIIGFITLFGIVCHFQTIFTLRKWQQELIKLDEGHLTSTSITWINRLIKEYEMYKQLQHESINTLSLVEKHFIKVPIRLFGIIKSPVGNVLKLQQLLPMTVIICGILGTFVGLTISMFEMQNTLTLIGTTNNEVSMNSIVAAISSPFQGMSLAFITSIAGISSSLLLNLFQTGFLSGGTSISYYKASILSEAESLLDHSVSAKINNEKPKDMMEKLLDRFSNKVQEAFHDSVSAFGDKMIHLTEELREVTTEMKALIVKQDNASEAFSSSSYVLKEFGNELSTTVSSLLSVRNGVDHELNTLQNAIKGLEKQIHGSTEKHEAGQRRFEQMLQRSDQLLKDSSTKTAEISSLFLKGLDEQSNRAYAKQEEMERRLYQKQEEMNYAFQDKQSQYYHAAQDFASSVHQLEKAWHDVVERLRREVIDKMDQSRNRISPPQQENRELIRTIELVSERSQYEVSQIQHYLSEVYQLLLRLYEQQQYMTTGPKRTQIPTRLNE
jgi:phosphate uptake regulator